MLASSTPLPRSWSSECSANSGSAVLNPFCHVHFLLLGCLHQVDAVPKHVSWLWYHNSVRIYKWSKMRRRVSTCGVALSSLLFILRLPPILLPPFLYSGGIHMSSKDLDSVGALDASLLWPNRDVRKRGAVSQ